VSASYGTHVELGAGGTLSLWWKQASHPSVSSAGEHAHQKLPASVGNPTAENSPSRDPCGSFLAPSLSIIASQTMSAPSSFATRIEPELTGNGIEVLRARYLKKNDHGQIVETPSEMFARVARHVAEVERRYAGDPATTADAFYEAMARLEFLPNSPALMNAGTRLGQLAACFVLPIGDSLDSIFGSLRDAALVHQTGGGVGYDFSRLRPKGDVVASTGGGSSGPVSFMEVFDAAVDAVRQGGRRRGANMGVLDVHHPDIEAFVTAKRDPQRLRNFNLSVAVDEAFMTAAAEVRPIALVNPRTGETTGSRQANELLQLIATSAWETGDPGLIFLDRINRDNPTPALGRISATNPCGEVPLLPYEACVLGSINLAALTRRGVFEWERFDALTDLGIRFLDDCIDASLFPLPQITTAVHRSRKIGLGVMGFADALIDLDIAYDDEVAIVFADRLMHRMAARATDASRQLAKARGPYPEFDQSREGTAGATPVRNATRLAIAPTGTLSLIAGCSSGIEPLFAVALERHVLDGRALVEVNARFEALATREGVWSPELQHKVLESGRVQQLTEVPAAVRRLFPTAHEIPAEYQLRVQAVFQSHVDNAVSKTINLPADATVSHVLEAYRRAFALGCKGITVYRHGAKVDQVLTTVRKSSVCPDCLSALEFSEGVTLCRACGFSSTS
jgi:ribonucleoside-diphosphate reductase alpha chain